MDFIFILFYFILFLFFNRVPSKMFLFLIKASNANPLPDKGHIDKVK